MIFNERFIDWCFDHYPIRIVNIFAVNSNESVILKWVERFDEYSRMDSLIVRQSASQSVILIYFCLSKIPIYWIQDSFSFIFILGLHNPMNWKKKTLNTTFYKFNFCLFVCLWSRMWNVLHHHHHVNVSVLIVKKNLQY